MGWKFTIAWVLAGLAAAAPTALAKTEVAHSGQVTATLSFAGKYPDYRDERLKIMRGGQPAYNAGVDSKWCGKSCSPLSASTHGSSIHVLDLEHTGQPDVVLDLYTGGAHCCVVEQVFSAGSVGKAYVKTERNFGDPGERIVDLSRNGRYEFLTADDSFAYTFTDFAASGLPIEVLTFSNRQFHDVTRRYPKLIVKDAARWLRTFKSMAKSGYQDTTGLIAAWAADEDLLGHSKLVASVSGPPGQCGPFEEPALPPRERQAVRGQAPALSAHARLSALSDGGCLGSRSPSQAGRRPRARADAVRR